MFGTDTATLAQPGNFPQVPPLSTAALDNAPAVEFDLPLDETDSPLTFEGLCELEPRLRALYNEVSAIKDDGSKPYFCANHTWDEWNEETGNSFKGRVAELVGYRRKEHPVLGTSRAYRVAYHTIYDALPDCRSCVCWGFQALVDERMGRNKRPYY